MKTKSLLKTSFALLAVGVVLSLCFVGCNAQAQDTIQIVNSSGGVSTYKLVSGSMQTNPISVKPATTATDIFASVPTGVATAAAGGWNVFKNFSITNPITIGVVGLQNGTGRYGVGLYASQAAVDLGTNAAVDVGFGLFAVQAQKFEGQKVNGWNFYSATLNIGVSQVETVPVLNIPLTIRVFSGPFTSLNGGVLLGEESGVSGDLCFVLSKKMYLIVGGGVVNNAGAAAAGLKPVMPMAHMDVNATF